MGREHNSAGTRYLSKLVEMTKPGVGFEYIVWEDRATVAEEQEMARKNKDKQKSGKTLKLDNGILKVIEEDPERGAQSWGSFKAERLLLFTAKSMAEAKMAEREALNDFFEEMLSVFWRKPEDPKYRSPSVEELRSCERASLKKAFRMVAATSCTLASALADVQASGMFDRLLCERRAEEARPVAKWQDNWQNKRGQGGTKPRWNEKGTSVCFICAFCPSFCGPGC